MIDISLEKEPIFEVYTNNYRNSKSKNIQTLNKLGINNIEEFINYNFDNFKNNDKLKQRYKLFQEILKKNTKMKYYQIKKSYIRNILFFQTIRVSFVK